MKWFSTTAILAGATFFSQMGQSEEMSSTKVESYRSPISDVNVEIKPLPALLSAVPGVGSAAFSVEGFVAPKVSLFTELAALDSNLPHIYDEDVKDRDNLYPRQLNGGSIDLGARYYGWLFGDSWYTGAKLGYSQMKAKWEYKDQVIEQTASALTPGIEAGYRWLWPSSFLMRLGAGVSGNVIQSQNVTTSADNEEVAQGVDDVKAAAKIPLLAKVDFGLGYQF